MRIGKALSIALICAPALLLAQSAGGPFDGTWTTNMSCDASEHMPAYTWTFVSTITNSTFHGQHGEEGGPGYMVMDGTIGANGSAKLHAKGKVSAGKAGLITQMKGNKYDYYVDAKFDGHFGNRQAGRGCGDSGAAVQFPVHQAGCGRDDGDTAAGTVDFGDASDGRSPVPKGEGPGAPSQRPVREGRSGFGARIWPIPLIKSTKNDEICRWFQHDYADYKRLKSTNIPPGGIKITPFTRDLP